MTLIPRWFRQPFERGLARIADGLVPYNVNPNTLTTIGLLLVVGSATAYGLGLVRWGGAALLLSGAFDVLDGKVARGGGRMSAFGAFYDSTLDRVGEVALFGGIAIFFVRGGVRPEWVVPAVLAAIVALGAGLIVSYTRARAEGLRLECKVGIVQRAERIVGLGAPTLLFGAGRDGWLLLGLVAGVAVLSALTVVQRVYHVHQLTSAPVPSPGRRDPVPALLDQEKRTSS